MPDPSSRTWTIGQLLNWTTDYFRKKGIESPRVEAEILLAHLYQCQRIMLYTRYDEVAEQTIRDQYRELVKKRVEGTPVAYLVGEKEFFMLRFNVSPEVLIPRPETELLVTRCLEILKDNPYATVLDVGTGSGNIAIALARNLPQIKITAIDICDNALKVAKQNAIHHGVEDRIQFLQSDMLQALEATDIFDVIVSNPPYISDEDYANLPPDIHEYEPPVALQGGPDGLRVIRELIEQARHHLKPNGQLLIEMGIDQHNDVCQIIHQYPEYHIEAVLKDDQQHDRVIQVSKVQ